eukprot:scaffold10274_cov88-Skeletonema_dohrnii-CCMP3373.AAC.1
MIKPYQHHTSHRYYCSHILYQYYYHHTSTQTRDALVEKSEECDEVHVSEAGSRKQEAGSRQQAAGSRQQAAGSRQQVTCAFEHKMSKILNNQIMMLREEMKKQQERNEYS